MTKPTTIAVATYNDKASAEHDYDAIWGSRDEGHLDHVAIATVEKDADGRLKKDRHNSTAKHMAWGGGILGGALTVISAPLGIVFLGPLAATSAVWAGAGGLVGHFWHNIPKDEVRRMEDVLEAGQYGLVVVAVNPSGTAIDALLVNAIKKVVADGVTDPDGALEHAFEKAEVSAA